MPNICGIELMLLYIVEIYATRTWYRNLSALTATFLFEIKISSLSLQRDSKRLSRMSAKSICLN